MHDMLKINFRLEKDEDGYPPASVETLWAEVSDQGYKIDSIPFFTKDATNGDTVSATADADGRLWFQSRVSSSTNSLVRIIFFDENGASQISKHLREMGCATEFIPDYKMMAVDVPESTSYLDVIRFIEQKSEQGILDYEEPIIRQ